MYVEIVCGSNDMVTKDIRDKLASQRKIRKEFLRSCRRIASVISSLVPFPLALEQAGLPEGWKNARRDSRRLLQEAPTPKLTVESRGVQLAVWRLEVVRSPTLLQIGESELSHLWLYRAFLSVRRDGREESRWNFREWKETWRV